MPKYMAAFDRHDDRDYSQINSCLENLRAVKVMASLYSFTSELLADELAEMFDPQSEHDLYVAETVGDAVVSGAPAHKPYSV